MNLKLTILAALVAAVAVAASAAPAQVPPYRHGGLTEFDGTVLSKNRDNRSFRLRDFERGTVRIFVTRNTRFERIAGFAGLKVGAKQHRVRGAQARRPLGGGRGRALRSRRPRR